jgi:hypothetical protein
MEKIYAVLMLLWLFFFFFIFLLFVASYLFPGEKYEEASPRIHET